MIAPTSPQQSQDHGGSCTTRHVYDNRAQSPERSTIRDGVDKSAQHEIPSPSRSNGDKSELSHPFQTRPMAPRKALSKEPAGLQRVALQSRKPQDSRAASGIRSGGSSETVAAETESQETTSNGVRKLSSAEMYELTSSPKAFPLYSSREELREGSQDPLKGVADHLAQSPSGRCDSDIAEPLDISAPSSHDRGTVESTGFKRRRQLSRPRSSSRKFSTPPLLRRTSRTSTYSSVNNNRVDTARLPVDKNCPRPEPRRMESSPPSPMPSTVPVPPHSLSTYLELELSSHPPPALYIHHSKDNDIPYESSRIKLERLQNFLLLPPQLEQVLWFGALACLDAWLYSFTLLPLRFLKAVSMLIHSWTRNIVREVKIIGLFVYTGSGRMWRRRRRSSITGHNSSPVSSNGEVDLKHFKDKKSPSFAFGNGGSRHGQPSPSQQRFGGNSYRHHRRTRSTPSALRQKHKADILKGLLILISCSILMHFDASRMYHGIRGQAAIKLYVIYNVLEVCDRLFSAIGQDVLECLFSKETLERKPDGRSKVLRPLWLFGLALIYNLVHATALFYQVITLNVAVNSYSNALLTLLMSNQFVEIKSTVFKKFEKENLFQLTCADVVERFQLWLMLTIIAARNIIETGGLSLNNGADSGSSANIQSSSILPKSFTLFPAWTGQIMGPFFLVLGSEMLVDWIKHAYISKFNLIKPAVYGRFLDVLAKDYYTNAFADQNLTRRLGLPVIPLSCLFIRASVQTYHMFLATHMPLPIPSTATSLSVDQATTSPAKTAALQHIDQIFRRALGRSSFGGGGGSPTLAPTPSWLDTDDFIAFTTMILFFLVLFLVLLAFKLVLGMCLLSFARKRYIGMKQREQNSGDLDAEGKRVGGWGVVEVDDAKRSWIYVDDSEGLAKLREREKRKNKDDDGFSGVSRYNMVAKRIW